MGGTSWGSSARGRRLGLVLGVLLALLLAPCVFAQPASEPRGPLPYGAPSVGSHELGQPFSPDGSVWFDDMESGQRWTTSGLWHLTTSASYSPPHGQWFGDEGSGTYAFARSHGELTSPSIPVTEGTAVEVSFCHRREVEYYPSDAYDCTFVQVSYGGGVWETLWGLDSRNPSSGAWERVSLPAVLVPPGATSMQIRFAFDTIDPFANDYPGWVIDDVAVVQREGPGQVETPSFSPAPGTYASPTMVTLSCGTTGASLHYTTDGAEPMQASPTYGGPILVSVTTTIRARAFKAGLAGSGIARGTFAIRRSGFADDMESGQEWEASGLWHLTAKWSRSPDHAQWFGDESTGTYSAGSAPSSAVASPGVRAGSLVAGRACGELTSTSVAVPGGSTVSLSFWHWREVEYYPGGSYDRTVVQVRYSGGTWKTVWSLDSTTPSGAAWEKVTRDLTVPSGATSLRVRFVFDSVDGYNNRYPGWFVDDVTVTQAGGGVALQGESSDLVCLCVPNPVTSLDTARFQVRGAEVERIRVEVYDVTGNLVWWGEEPGTEVIWHAVDLAGLPVANGVYLYRALAQLDGRWTVVGVEALAVLR